MIEFYKAGTVEFEGGEILNEVYEAKIVHERNGRFDLEFKVPIQETKFEMHDIFLAHVPYLGKQAFYLTDVKKKLNHIIIYAKHIFFMIDKNVTNDLHTLTNGDTGQLIMDKFKSSLQIPTQFNFTSDITNRHIFNKPSYNNALEVLAEGKHSILGQWGGVLVMDNWDIKLKERWGRDTEYLIAKRKNISDLEIRDIGDNITTRLFLKKELEDKSIITAVIDSPLINEYPQVYGEVRETTDQTVESIEDLIVHGENIFRTQRIDLPTESFEFEVTEDVKDYEFTIDDTALIYYSDYDIYKRVIISSYEYNPIERKYLKINFGERPKSMSQQVAEKVDKEYIKPTINSLDEIIAGIIGDLDDPTGGVIQFTEDAEGNIIEMMILDNADRELAKDVWRFNIQGLSHSSNGINGDFDIAMTQDGKFVADFIATGTLNAALVKAGILHSLEGNTWIDMETGHFKLGGMEQDEDGFRVVVGGKNVENNLIDVIEQADNNAMEVAKKIGANEVVSSINVQPSSVKIDTKNLDLSGDLNLRGKFANYDSISGKKAVELSDSKLDFYDYDGSTRTTPVGTIFSSRSGGGTTRVGTAFNSEANAAISIGYAVGTRYSEYMIFNKDGNTNGYPIAAREPMSFSEDARIFGDKRLRLGSGSNLFEDSAKLVIRGHNNNGFQLGSSSAGQIIDWNPATLGTYPIALRKNTAVLGYFKATRNALFESNLSVTGTKNSLQKTENYGDRLINAYETAEYYFGDIGSGVINENGECLIYIDDIFAETINTNVNYHVFTQKYNGDITKIDRYKNYFIVYGESGTEFSWELKGKRKGYENHRLEVPQDEFDVNVEPSSIENDNYSILSAVSEGNKELNEILNGVLDFSLVDELLI